MLRLPLSKKQRSFRILFSLCVLSSLMLSGCLKQEETELEKQIKREDEIIRTYLQTNNIQANKDDAGFYYQALTSNPLGVAPTKDDVVSINYKISKLGGAVFDSLTTANGSPLRLQLYSSALLPYGLEGGLQRMRKGEKFRLFIPSFLAYNDYHYSADFPAYSNLVIDVEMVDVWSLTAQKAYEDQLIQQYISNNGLTGAEKQSSGLYYQKLQEGEGNPPAKLQTVELSYIGRFLDNTEFDRSGTTPYQLQVGVSPLQVIAGFDEGVSKMRKSEKARLIIPSHLAYGAGLQIVPVKIRQDLLDKKLINARLKIKPFSILVFEVDVTKIQ